MSKFQDIRIKFQQTASPIKFLFIITVILQIVAYLVLFYEINLKLLNGLNSGIFKKHVAIFPPVNPHIPHIDWAYVYKTVQFKQPLIYSFLVWLIFAVGIYFIFKSNITETSGPEEKKKNEKIIRGAKMESVKLFQKSIKRSEIFSYIGPIPITSQVMFRNLLIVGAPGTGKTTIIKRILQDSKDKEHNSVIYDNKNDFTSMFYNPERDIIFNPADARCPAWNIFDEIKNKADVSLVANAVIPATDKNNPNGYFINNARHILEAIIIYLKMNEKSGIANNENFVQLCNESPENLLILFEQSDIVRNECIMAITPLKAKEVGSMMSELTSHIKVFTVLPSKPDGPNLKSFNITRDFLSKKNIKIFINSNQGSEAFMRPLLTLFVELLTRRFLSVPDKENTPTIFYLDEVSSLNKMDGPPDLLDKGRSKMASVILGIQDVSKMIAKYGKELVINMMNSCNNKVFLRVNNNEEAELISKQIGTHEIERFVESDSVSQGQYTHTKSSQIVEKAMFLPSTIMNFKDLECVVKIFTATGWFHVNIPLITIEKIAEGFIESDRLEIQSVGEQKTQLKSQATNGNPEPESQRTWVV